MNIRTMHLILTVMLLAPLAPLHAAEKPTQKPNILFILADDASFHFGQSYRSPSEEKHSSKQPKQKKSE